MNVYDILGWFGNLSYFVAIVLIARKNRVGFIFNTVGNSLYLVQGIAMGLSSLWVISIVLIGGNIYGWIKWGNK